MLVADLSNQDRLCLLKARPKLLVFWSKLFTMPTPGERPYKVTNIYQANHIDKEIF